MGFKVEIERKFLIIKDKLPPLHHPLHMTQGYLSFEAKANVRIRLQEDVESSQKQAYLTIKGRGLVGRDEFEYEIPYTEADKLITLSQASLVSKHRYILPAESEEIYTEPLKWEIDIFEGDNAGLLVAEIELPAENFKFSRPEWLGREVTEEAAYKNAVLAQHPFKEW